MLGGAIAGLGLALFAGSYVIVPLLAGPPRLAGDAGKGADKNNDERSFMVWLFWLTFFYAVILAAVYFFPLISVIGVVLVLLAMAYVRGIRGGQRWHILEDRTSHGLLALVALFAFVAWNTVLALVKADRQTFLILGFITWLVSLVLFAAFFRLHERRLAIAVSDHSRKNGWLLSATAWILSLIALVGNMLGPGPWPVLGVGRYDALCVVEKEGVDVLASEYEVLLTRQAGKGEDMPQCNEGPPGAYRCRFHIWWGVGDEWLVSKADAPTWIFGPEKKYRILPLASRYVRGCVPI